MQTLHSKKYYEERQEVLFEKYRKHCDFENDLKILLPDFSDLVLPEEELAKAVEIITGITAKRIAERAKAELVKKKHMIENIRSGKASLGYTNHSQEISEWHDLQEGFEFACYMLGEFKRKYGIA